MIALHQRILVAMVASCLNEDTAIYNEYLEHCSVTACHVMYKIFCSSKGYSIVNLFIFQSCLK